MKTGSNLTRALMIVAAFLVCFALSNQASAAPQVGDPGCTNCPQIVTNCECGQTSCQNCAPAPTVSECGCRKPGCLACLRSRLGSRRACQSCESDSGCTQCPKCEGDFCKLELDNSNIQKTCFKVEQKPVCIPPVRMPWMKCCPPGKSKTRLVSKLSTHTYECPNCSYKWTLQKAAQTEAPIVQPDQLEPTPANDTHLPQGSGATHTTAQRAPSAEYRVKLRDSKAASKVNVMPWMSSAPVVRK